MLGDVRVAMAPAQTCKLCLYEREGRDKHLGAVIRLWVIVEIDCWHMELFQNYTCIILELKRNWVCQEKGFSGPHIRGFTLFHQVLSTHKPYSYLSHHVPEQLKTFQLPIKLRIKCKSPSIQCRILDHWVLPTSIQSFTITSHLFHSLGIPNFFT